MKDIRVREINKKDKQYWITEWTNYLFSQTNSQLNVPIQSPNFQNEFLKFERLDGNGKTCFPWGLGRGETDLRLWDDTSRKHNYSTIMGYFKGRKFKFIAREETFYFLGSLFSEARGTERLTELCNL